VTLKIVALKEIYINRCWDAVPGNAVKWNNWTESCIDGSKTVREGLHRRLALYILFLNVRVEADDMDALIQM
jgi:hypothetical protein